MSLIGSVIQSGGGGAVSAEQYAELLANIGTNELNNGLTNLRAAISEGWSVTNMIDGIADEYNDQTGVAAGDTTAIYTPSGDYYSGQSVYPDGFEESDVPTSVSSQTYFVKLSDLGLSGSVSIKDIRFFIGSAGASSLAVNYLTATPNGTEWDITHRGADSVTGSDGDAHVFTLPSAAALNADTDSIGISSAGSGSWHRYKTGGSNLQYTASVITGNTTGTTLTNFANTPSVHAQVQVGSGANFNLQSIAFVANSVPTSGRVVVLHDPIDSVTLNTDLILSISRDDGSTWTAVTLTLSTTYSSDINILVSNDLDISGQPSDTDVKYRIVTANTKDQRIHGVYLQWR